MNIRCSRADEREVIRATHLAAFAGDPADGADEAASVADLAVALLDDPTARPCLSLLAERDGAVVGSVLFTPVSIDGPGHAPPAAILGPLAVVPAAQRSGVGTALVEAGVRRLGEAGTALVFVLGDSRYYGRHGYAPMNADGARPPYPSRRARPRRCVH